MIDTTRLPERHSPTSNRTLVEGTYSCSDARDLAVALLEATINTQKVRNLRAQVNQQAPDAGALIDLSRLEEARRQLPDVLAQAAEAGLRVRVRAAIELEVVDEAPPR